MSKNKSFVIPIIIVIILLIAGLMVGLSDRMSSYDSKTSPASITNSPSEDLKEYDGETITSNNFLAFTTPLSDCTKSSSFRSDYKEGRKASVGEVLLVTGYGSRCEVGDRIVMYACEGNSYNPGKCTRLFDDDYVKESQSDRIDLTIECGKGAGDGISNCYDRQWYIDKINDKYVGYDCVKCDNDVYSGGEVEFMDVKIVPEQVSVGEEFTIIGTARVKGGAVHGAVIESGVDFYGSPLSIVYTDSGVGACDNDLTIGVKFNANQNDFVGFKLRDVSYEVGDFRIPVYAVKGCIDEIGANNQVVYDTAYVEISVVESDGNGDSEDGDTGSGETITYTTCYWCQDETLITETDIVGETCPIGTSITSLDCTIQENRDDNTGPKQVYEETWFIIMIIVIVLILVFGFYKIISKRRY